MKGKIVGGSLAVCCGLLHGGDHVLFNDGVSRKGVHEATESHQAEEGNDVESLDGTAEEEDENDENTRQKSHA